MSSLVVAALNRSAGLCARLVPERSLTDLADAALRFRLRLLERSRQVRARSGPNTVPTISAHDGEPLRISILEREEPWNGIVSPACDVPGMLTPAEKRYYAYITRFFSGVGAVVEVGTWLGLSTTHIVRGLLANPMFSGTLHCFDDFVWRSSWMDRWLIGTGLEAPADLESFEHLFREQTREIAPHIRVTRARLAGDSTNSQVPALQWSDGPIELCFIDCGRSLEVNEAWYRALSPHFIPRRTLLVLQDWQNHKAVPEIYWENMKIFTDSKQSSLELIHEVRRAGIGTFLYCGMP